MPNFKGTRKGLGIRRNCVKCQESYEVYSMRQSRCSTCSKNPYIKKVRSPKEIKDHKWFYKQDGKYFYLHISELEASMSFRHN